MEQNLSGTVMVVKIITIAMALGLTIFTLIAFVQGKWDPANLDVMTLIACIMTLGNLLASFVVPRIIAANGRKQVQVTQGKELTRDDFAGIFQTTSIIGLALCEGAGFFAAIAYMSEGHYLALVMVLFCLAGILLRFPTLTGAENWADEQVRLRKMG